MNKVLYKLFVSMAGFLNGEHSKAQLPEVIFSCSPPIPDSKMAQEGTQKYIWGGGGERHTANESTPPPAPHFHLRMAGQNTY